jgi:hypothetical protein
MNTSREPDALLRAYLAEGMDVLPDRVVDAVLDEVHHTRQRVVIGPRRTPFMLRNVLAAAVIAALVIGTGSLLGAFNPRGDVGNPSPSAVPSPSSAPPSPTPSATPGAPTFPIGQSDLPPGSYRLEEFSQPMNFTVPDSTAEFGPDEKVTGEVWPNRHNAVIRFQNINASITIHDDAWINTDLCRITEDSGDVPETPAGVAAWLHEQADRPVDAAARITVTDRPDFTVDGRVAKVFDIVMGATCGTDKDPVPGQPDVWFGANETHRIYAIPTGTDTILVVTWNQGQNAPPEAIGFIADRLVLSLDFPE